MSKIFPLLILVIAAGAALYYLPPFLNLPFSFFNSAGDPRSEIILVSLDGGESFEKISFPEIFGTPDVFDVKQSLSSPAVFYAATDRGLFRSQDWGLTWREAGAEGLKNAAVLKIVENRKKPGEFYFSVFSGNRGTLYAASGDFSSFKTVFEETGVKIKGLDFSGERVILGLSDGRILSYSSATETFRVLASLPPVSGVFADGFTIYALTSDGFFAGSFDGEFRKLKSGEARASAVGGGSIYLASDKKIFKSADGGENWFSFSTLASPEAAFNAVAFKDNFLYLASDKKLYKNAGFGGAWKILFSLRSGRVISAVFVSSDGKIVAVGAKRKQTWTF